jgi:hypothetical protein
MSVGARPDGLRHRRRGLGHSLRSGPVIFCPFSLTEDRAMRRHWVRWNRCLITPGIVTRPGGLVLAYRRGLRASAAVMDLMDLCGTT